jgi:hypothetical protein
VELPQEADGTGFWLPHCCKILLGVRVVLEYADDCPIVSPDFWSQGDLTAFRRTTEAPFTILGEMTFSTREDLDRFFQEVRIDGRGMKLTFTLANMVSVDEYAKTARDREKEFLSKLRKPEVRVVYAQMREGAQPREEPIALFVRAVGSRVHVIGVGEGKSDRPR